MISNEWDSSFSHLEKWINALIRIHSHFMFEYVKIEQWTNSFHSLLKKTNIETGYLSNSIAHVLHSGV